MLCCAVLYFGRTSDRAAPVKLCTMHVAGACRARVLCTAHESLCVAAVASAQTSPPCLLSIAFSSSFLMPPAPCHKPPPTWLPPLPQAMLTTRKGNKRFGFYDLNVSLEWEATPVAAAAAAAPGEAAADAAAAAEALAGASLECVGTAAAAAAQGGSEGEAAAAAGGEQAGNSKEGAAAAAAVVSGTMDVKEFGSVSCGPSFSTLCGVLADKHVVFLVQLMAVRAMHCWSNLARMSRSLGR